MADKYEFSNEYLKAMFYGQPGAGKTRLAASAAADPRLAPVLMLESFGNPISLRKVKDKPDIITIGSLEDYNEPYDWLSSGQDPNHPYVERFGLHPPYKTLIIDSITEVQRFVIRKVSGVDYTSPGNLTSPLGRQGFGQVLGTMLNWGVHYIGLDMNVILTSLESEKMEGSMIHRAPLLWGQSGNEFSGYVFMVLRIVTKLALNPAVRENVESDEDYYNVACFKETLLEYAKDQYDTGATYMANPTMSKVMDLLEQSS
jgi:hypothetical protein